jgi:hypothetical protein
VVLLQGGICPRVGISLSLNYQVLSLLVACFGRKYVSVWHLETKIIPHNGYRMIVTSLERCGCILRLLNLNGLGCFSVPYWTLKYSWNYHILWAWCGCWDSSVLMASGLWAVWSRCCDSIPARDKGFFSLFQKVLGGFVAHPASYSVCTMSFVLVIKRPGRITDFRYRPM